CAHSAPPAATGNAASTPWPHTRAPTRSSSRSPTSNGPGAAGAPREMRSSRSLPPLVPVTTIALRATKPEPLDPEGQPAMERLLYRPKEAAQVLGISRDKLYDLLRTGRLPSVKDGGARFITADALRAYVARLEAEAAKAA